VVVEALILVATGAVAVALAALMAAG